MGTSKDNQKPKPKQKIIVDEKVLKKIKGGGRIRQRPRRPVRR